MTLKVSDAKIDVFKPLNTSTTPDFTIPSSDILSVEINKQIQESKDTGTVRIANENGQYGGSNNITSGDKLKFYAQDETDGSLQHVWTFIPGPPTYNYRLADERIRLDCADFVFQVLQWRIAFDTFENENISTIVTDLISDNAPEVDTSKIQSVSTSTDYSTKGSQLLEAVGELASRGNAALYNDDEGLVFEPLGNITSEFLVTESTSDFGGEFKISGADDQLTNEVRVTGGKSQSVDEQQTSVDSYESITDANQKTHQLAMRKSEVDRIEIWTRKTGSGEDFIARLQKDEGGSPVAINDQTSDIAKRTLAPSFVTDDGWTTFLFPEHDLPEPNPWLIIETSGSSGQEVGVNSSGNLAYKAYYPYPVIVRSSDKDSVDEYRRREFRVQNDNLTTRQTAQDEAQGILEHRSNPKRTIEGAVQTERVHNLNIGQGIRATFPDENLDEVMALTGVRINYDGSLLDRNMTFTSLSAL